MAEWRITAVEAGGFSSYALFGMMIGALVFGPLADKFGRKNGQYTMNDNYNLQKRLKSEMKGFTVKQLFKNGRTLSTLMFWIAFFMCLFVMYGLSTWLPKIMGGAGGYELGSSLTFLVVLNLGAVVGAIVGGRLADRYGSKRILVTFLVIGFNTLTMLSLKLSMIMLYVLFAIAGGTTTGTQIVTNVYIS